MRCDDKKILSSRSEGDIALAPALLFSNTTNCVFDLTLIILMYDTLISKQYFNVAVSYEDEHKRVCFVCHEKLYSFK